MHDKAHDTASHDRISETTETQIQYLTSISETTSDLTVSLEKSFSVWNRNIFIFKPDMKQATCSSCWLLLEVCELDIPPFVLFPLWRLQKCPVLLA